MMELICITLTAIATITMAVFGMLQYRDLRSASVSTGNVIRNTGKQPIILTYVKAKGCTLSETIRDNKGYEQRKDSKKDYLPLDIMLCNGDEYSLSSLYVYVDGTEYKPFLQVKHNISFPFSFHNLHIVALPYKKVTKTLKLH